MRPRPLGDPGRALDWGRCRTADGSAAAAVEMEPPWGVEPQTYALRESRSPMAPCTPSASVHVEAVTVLIGEHDRTASRATNRATTKIINAVFATGGTKARAPSLGRWNGTRPKTDAGSWWSESAGRRVPPGADGRSSGGAGGAADAVVSWNGPVALVACLMHAGVVVPGTGGSRPGVGGAAIGPRSCGHGSRHDAGGPRRGGCRQVSPGSRGCRGCRWPRSARACWPRC